MRFQNASEAIEKLLEGYDIRLRPDFAGELRYVCLAGLTNDQYI